MIIRELVIGDLEQIVTLEKRAFSVGPYSKGMLKRMFLMERSFSFVADDEGTVLGYVSAIPLDDENADVESIAVDPDSQGKGVGGMLLDAIEDGMRERGFIRSILEVRDMNFESVRFYKKHGYEEVKHMKTYYREYFRGSRGAYRMAKKL